MKQKILYHLDEPELLERLYRSDTGGFKRAFGALYPALRGNLVAEVWHSRLRYEREEIYWGTKTELVFLVMAVLLAAVLAKLPAIAGLNEEFFYSRNIGFLVFPVLIIWFASRQSLTMRMVGFLIVALLGSVVFINLLPGRPQSDTTMLSCIHILLFQWMLLGFAYCGRDIKDVRLRLGYLRYNGDLLVVCAIMLIAGVIVSSATFWLFSLIGVEIDQFYFQYIVVCSLPAVPILGSYLIQMNPELVGRVTAMVARIFSPVVLVMLVVFLVSMFMSGRSLYTDREFLFIFNLVLVGVLALIFFSVAGLSGGGQHRGQMIVLLMLSVVTIAVNAVALSAILFRITEWGFTPNRTAVLGANLLMLVHLVLVAVQIFSGFRRAGGNVEKAVVDYLPVYGLWAAVVTFIFPIVWG